MSSSSVLCGLDRVDELTRRLRGKRIGLCCNAASVDGHLKHAADVLRSIEGADLRTLFAPEHGIRGAAQDMEVTSETPTDPVSGARIHSLYGEDEDSLRPTPEMLDGLDVVVFDVQDVGSRYYTFVYTLSFLMETAGEAGIEVLVLDRPNPIGGRVVEGNTVSPGFTSFVGRFPLAARHGMTVGELAIMFRDRFGVHCRLNIVEMKGWNRSMMFGETGLFWVMPSPNMPTEETALVYPGGCLFEGTNLSEGRGTTRPFELVGAPYLDGREFADQLAAMCLPGVEFRPLSFKPMFQKWAGVHCGGVQIHVTDRESFKPFLTGIAVIKAARETSDGGFRWREETYEFVDDRPAIDLLFGGPDLRRGLESGLSVSDLEEGWSEETEDFLRIREPHLLY